MKYIDTHAHLVSNFNDESIESLIVNAEKNNVKYILIPGTTIKDSFEALEISQKHSNIFAGFGIHPSDASDEVTNKIDINTIKGFKFIGETGIDLYHEENPPLQVQIRSFKKHLNIARELDLPIEIHTRDAYKQVYDILKNYSDLKIILHSFTGDLEWANKFIKIGAYISFSGIVTFKNAKEVKHVMQSIPLNRILIETDAPFLAPTPFRGKKNKPEFVKYIGDFIAKNRPEEDALKIIFETTKKLFNI